MKTILKGKLAELVLRESCTPIDWYKQHSKDFENICGYFQSEIPGVYIVFDFTDGREVFVEEFNSVEECLKWIKEYEILY